MLAYVVLDVVAIESKHGGKIYQIELVCTQSRLQYKTYVDPKLRNFPNWNKIIANPKKGYILSNIQIRDPDKYVVSADSKPRILSTYDTKDQLFDELYSYWKELDQALV